MLGNEGRKAAIDARPDPSRVRARTHADAFRVFDSHCVIFSALCRDNCPLQHLGAALH
jgi:hypothetical protein